MASSVEPVLFLELVDRVGPRIKKQDSNYRFSLARGLKTAIILRHLASGESCRSHAYGFRIGHTTISGIIFETCEAIIESYMKL